jgi:alkanesulfonate monooxygenase SsuD/methylene tetrahydromethanopterin reductase-like flavin-dependent oxidoreductase (luciferase family)
MRGPPTGSIAVSSDVDDPENENLMTRFAYFCGHEQWHPEQLVEHARLAEQAGFDMLVVSEHFHPWVDDTSAAGFAWSTMGAMAAATNKVEFATGVTTPLWRYHPAVVAQAAATLDRLSAGRFNLGVGTGENINEGPLGYQFPGYAERAARMTEALEIMRRLLDGEKLTFQGDYYTTDRAKLYSPPLGPVPIWLAARVLNPAQTAAHTAGRPAPRVLATRWSVLAESEDEAWEALRPWRGLRAPGRLEAVDPADLREKADRLPRREVLDRYSIVADADQIVETYRPLIEGCAADIVAVQMTSVDQESLIKMLGREVLPRLRVIAT